MAAAETLGRGPVGLPGANQLELNSTLSKNIDLPTNMEVMRLSFIYT